MTWRIAGPLYSQRIMKFIESVLSKTSVN